MKILDRYILITFLKNYLMSLLVLIGLYIVLDMVFAFDEFAEAQTRAGASGVSSALAVMSGIADYYFYQSFRIFAHLSGIIPVVAAAFTLFRLTRFNELTASLAAGVPLIRTATPIILASLGLNGLLVIDQELIIPHIIPQLVRKHDEIQQSAEQKSNRTFAIKAMQDDTNKLLVAARYHPPSGKFPPRMEQIDVVQLDVEQQPLSHTYADGATWDASRSVWVLENGKTVSGLLPKDTRSPEQPADVFITSITPDEINLYRSGDFVELLSTAHINQLLDRPKSYGMNNLLRVKHSRITQVILNVILLLLAIPCVMSREPGKLKLGAVRCVVLCGACLATIFLCYQLAGTPPSGAEWADRWPLLMAWMPIFLFGPLAVFLLDRMHRVAT